MDVIADFEAVIQEVSNARPVPFSASAIVDRKALLERLEALLEAVPGELKKARWIIEDREEVLARIQREAQETLERARRERDRMLSRPEVDRAASVEAERVIDAAKSQAREIRLEAEHFVDGKLASLEVGLQKMLALVQSASTSFTDMSGPPPRPSLAPKRAMSPRLALEPDGDEEDMRPADPLEMPHTEARPVHPVVADHQPVVEPQPSGVADRPPADRPPVPERRPAPVAAPPPALERRPSPRTQAPAPRDRPKAPRQTYPRRSGPAAPPTSQPGLEAVQPRLDPRLEPKKREEPATGSAARTLGLGVPRVRSVPARPAPAERTSPGRAEPPGGPPGVPAAQAPAAPASSTPVSGPERDAAPAPRIRPADRADAATASPAAPPERPADRPGERVAESERTGTVRVIRTRIDRPEGDPPDSLF